MPLTSGAKWIELIVILKYNVKVKSNAEKAYAMNEAIFKNEYMHNLFRYIENNISADLDTALLSSVGFVSRDKLYHDFYNISGHSVKEYVRKRRLSNALALIKTSDMGLTNIAFGCGYSSR